MRTLGLPSESMRYPESGREGILKQPGPKQEPTMSKTFVVSQKYHSKIFVLLFPITNLSMGRYFRWKEDREKQSAIVKARRESKEVETTGTSYTGCFPVIPTDTVSLKFHPWVRDHQTMLLSGFPILPMTRNHMLCGAYIIQSSSSYLW